MKLRVRPVIAWVTSLAVVAFVWWALPPLPGTTARVATRLAQEAGCPRALPIMPHDTNTTLSADQQCGVVWKALGALPDSVRTYLESSPEHLRAVRVLLLRDTWSYPHRRASLVQLVPARPWWEYQRVSSSWYVGMSVLGGTIGAIYEIKVDRRSGVAYRITGVAPENVLAKRAIPS